MATAKSSQTKKVAINPIATISFTKKSIILYSIGFIVVIAVIIWLITFLSKKPVNNDAMYKQQILLIQEQIKAIQVQRTIDSTKIVESSRDIELHRQNDEILKQKYNDNQVNHKKIDKRYDEIPNTIRNLNKDQLRRELSDYKNSN